MNAVTFRPASRCGGSRKEFARQEFARQEIDRATDRHGLSHVSELMSLALARHEVVPAFAAGPAQKPSETSNASIPQNSTRAIKEDAMLLLSRKPTETIVINDSVVVKIVKISGGRVAIGIEAPPEVQIRRGELVAREDARELCALETV
jgi:carbon storage regulator